MDRGYKSSQRRLIPAAVALIAVVAASPCAAPAVAEEAVQTESVTIYGQSELPKVLYIVPWKRRQADEIDMPNSKSLAGDVLEPIDPQIFRRQIHYYDLMMGAQDVKK